MKYKSVLNLIKLELYNIELQPLIAKTFRRINGKLSILEPAFIMNPFLGFCMLNHLP